MAQTVVHPQKERRPFAAIAGYGKNAVEDDEAEIARDACVAQRGVAACEVERTCGNHVLYNLAQIYAYFWLHSEAKAQCDEEECGGDNGVDLVFQRIGGIGMLYVYDPVMVGALGLAVDY